MEREDKTIPRKICNYITCNERIPYSETYCSTHKHIKQIERYHASKSHVYECRQWSYLYNTCRWKKRRAAQLIKQPLCEQCLRDGVIRIATVCDHIIDHKGDRNSFYNGEVQTMCHSCHSRKTMQDNRHDNKKE